MDFEIKTIITEEYEDSAFNFDLIELETFLKKGYYTRIMVLQL